MLGSMGFGNVKEIITHLLEEKNVTIIVTYGTNEKLYKELTEYKNKNLLPLKYTNNINDLIYTSDIVLSKPGGLLSTEIASIHKPQLHIYPIPSIETYNANFFEEKFMSIKCQTKEEIIENAKKLLQDKTPREKIISSKKNYINQNSAKDLVNLNYQKLKKTTIFF